MDGSGIEQTQLVPKASESYIIGIGKGPKLVYALGWNSGTIMFYIDPDSGDLSLAKGHADNFTQTLRDVPMENRPSKIQSSPYVQAIYYHREDRLGKFEKGYVRKIFLSGGIVRYIFFSTDSGFYHFRNSSSINKFIISKDLGSLDQLQPCGTQEETPAT